MPTKIPGIQAKHAIISDNCRQLRGDEGAIDEALDRLKQEYVKLMEHWPLGKEVKFHVVLTVDYPR